MVDKSIIHITTTPFPAASANTFPPSGYTIYQFNPWHLPIINVPMRLQYNGINTTLDITLYLNKVVSTIVNYPCTVSNCILDDQIIIVGSPHLTCIQWKLSISTHTTSTNHWMII